MSSLVEGQKKDRGSNRLAAGVNETRFPGEYSGWLWRLQFPDSSEDGIIRPRGRSKRVSAMTKKVIAFEFVVPTVLAVALGIVLSIGAVFLTNKYLGPIDQAEANFSATADQ